jgi:diketogulonate reductase-like aldo/keto reductase
MMQTFLTLNDGASIPQLGLGTWQTPDAQAADAVRAALEIGYRLIDTAAVYGNESGVGAGLRAAGLPREQVFVTTKLWNDRQGFDSTLSAFDESLARLQLDYVDLYLIHWLVSYPPQPDGNLSPKGTDGKLLIEHVDILDTWGALESVVDKGLTKHIGLSNCSIEMLERLQFSPKVRIQPYAVQVETSIYNQQLAMIQYLEPRGVQLTTSSSFANARTGPGSCEDCRRAGKDARPGRAQVPPAAVADRECHPEERDAIAHSRELPARRLRT